MSAAMTFKGVYRYAGTSELEAAIAAVRELVEGEDDDFPDLFEDGGLRRKGLELKVDVDWSAPSDFYFAYETIVEALAERAIAGSVESTLEGVDGTEVFPAGPRDDDS